MEHVTEGSWDSLPVPLHPQVLEALRELGFPYMTPVQVSARGQVGRRGGGGGRRPVGLEPGASQASGCGCRRCDAGQ
jgi:hypothetical protein